MDYGINVEKSILCFLWFFVFCFFLILKGWKYNYGDCRRVQDRAQHVVRGKGLQSSEQCAGAFEQYLQIGVSVHSMQADLILSGISYLEHGRLIISPKNRARG